MQGGAGWCRVGHGGAGWGREVQIDTWYGAVQQCGAMQRYAVWCGFVGCNTRCSTVRREMKRYEVRRGAAQ